MATLPPRPKGPWFHHFDYWNDLACAYLKGLLNAPNDERIREELGSYSRFAETRLIFESNLLEGSGLSEGETRKLIDENFPYAPADYMAFRTLPKNRDWVDDEAIHRMVSIIEKQRRVGRSLQPSFSHGRRSRRALEVLMHRSALRLARNQAEEAMVLSLFRDLIADGVEVPQPLTQFVEERSPSCADRPWEYLTETFIRSLHETMATDLLPSDAGVNAGEYRIDDRTVGPDVAFPSPALIPGSMREYVKRSNDLFNVIWENANMFSIAAEVSYGLVRIHPFPDFNGRVSRLILMMALLVRGVPFPVSLLGKAKERHRYITALRHANRGDLNAYKTLIAMRTAAQFQEVDENLQNAGLPSLLIFATKEDR